MSNFNWVLNWKLKHEKKKICGEVMMLSLLDTSVSIDKGLTGKITAVLNQPLAVEHETH